MLRDAQARDALVARIVGIGGLHASGLLWYDEQNIEVQITSTPTVQAQLELNSLCDFFNINVRIAVNPDLQGHEQEPLINHHKWRLEYRSRRYLEYVSNEKLFSRMRYAMENITILSDGGKVGLLQPDDEGFFFMELFSHTHEEMTLRDIKQPPDGFLAEANIPDPGMGAPNAIKNYSKSLDGCLFKFSKKKYLEKILEDGIFQISPASAYKDPSLNNAIRDSELELTVFVQPEEIKLKLKDGSYLKPKGVIDFTSKVDSNYYVYCMGQFLFPRLFNDFDADSVLIIRDRDEFLRRLISGVEKSLPRWKGVHASVAYTDPYIPIPGVEAIVHFTKLVQYFYQREYRIVWFPPKGETFAHLDPIDIEIGALSDICDLVEL